MSQEIKIAPSILSADFSRLGEEVTVISKSGGDLIHIDVMDGHFVPNLTFGAPIIKSIRGCTFKEFDVHLMIENPEKHLKNYVDAGADSITVHIEAIMDNPVKVLESIRAYGKKVGVALRPNTPPEIVAQLFPHLDRILVMTVEPGFGGQKFLAEEVRKIARLRKWVDEHKTVSNQVIEISVDGGINCSNIAAVVQAGADIVVAGSAVFDTPAYGANIEKLRQSATESV